MTDYLYVINKQNQYIFLKGKKIKYDYIIERSFLKNKMISLIHQYLSKFDFSGKTLIIFKNIIEDKISDKICGNIIKNKDGYNNIIIVSSHNTIQTIKLLINKI